mmetsp:Transcript_105575/g.207080  ORF Transcript_105575/g.207080 Transcript_105575/m.207080 type:complete len:111 (-) Transcript_105575:1228-1560(-)
MGSTLETTLINPQNCHPQTNTSLCVTGGLTRSKFLPLLEKSSTNSTPRHITPYNLPSHITTKICSYFYMTLLRFFFEFLFFNCYYSLGKIVRVPFHLYTKQGVWCGLSIL